MYLRMRILKVLNVLYKAVPKELLQILQTLCNFHFNRHFDPALFDE